MNQADQSLSSKQVSRRAFLAGTGGFVAGAALGSRLFSAVGLAAPAQADVPEWPWPYVPLDPEAVRRKGYEACKSINNCMYGGAEGILNELREKVGHPFTLIPSDMFRYGAGGIVSWGTVCGALNGAAAVMSLVTPQEACFPLVNELMGWYCETALPTAKSNAYGQPLAQSVSGSPLCHVSVSKWCDASGIAFGTPEQAERCARLTGDVCAKAVELLNAHAAGKFVPAYTAPASVAECMSCHGPEGMFDTIGNMDCLGCHEPH